jgi:glycerate 2-kinase
MSEMQANEHTSEGITGNTELRRLLVESFLAAVAAADPLKVLPSFLPAPPAGRTLVIGAGKAAGSMALAAERGWPARAPLEGLAITRYRHGLLTNRIQVIEAGHPMPDEAGEKAAAEALKRVRTLGRDDLLLGLVSGGGSALLALPAKGLTIEDLKTTTRELLHCGAPIQEVNTVRKHLSAVQGGRLAAACRSPVVALIVSDVTGDDPADVASGPFSPDPSTYRHAWDILERYDVAATQSVRAHLEQGMRGEIEETPKPGDKAFAKVTNHVIATAQQSLQAAAGYFRERGIQAVVLGDTVTGEAREVAKVYGALARQIASRGEPWKPPVALLSGGECTVSVRRQGKGGRCSEFLLALALDLKGLPKVHAIACDTDGIDGTQHNAGALLAPDSLDRAAASGLAARKMLEANDSFTFFEKLSDLVVTGPTRTNVNDYRAILIG